MWRYQVCSWQKPHTIKNDFTPHFLKFTFPYRYVIIYINQRGGDFMNTKVVEAVLTAALTCAVAIINAVAKNKN